MWFSTITSLLVLLVSFVCAALTLQDYYSNKWREKTHPHHYPTTTTQSPIDAQYDFLKVRHHRHPNLERVMNEIHQKKAGRRSTTTTTTTTTTDEGLFYEDYADNNDYDDNDWTDQYDDNEDDNNEYEDENVMVGWQAEEPTERSLVVPAHREVSPLTKQKWDTLGTHAKVEETRRQHYTLNSNSQVRSTNAVVEHFMKVRLDAQCRRPLPRVISVQSEHPDATKTYTPHCTILFRCADDTGCCTTFGTRCGPKTQEPVELYFYIKTLGKQETRVEKLTFYNHTECECVGNSTKNTPETAVFPSTQPESEENQLFSDETSNTASVQPHQRCKKCPKEFTPKFRYLQGCTCDCDEYNEDCLRMKEGKEHLSLIDRMCIMENECGIPSCEYGSYLRHYGRCRLKHEGPDTRRHH